MFNACNSTLGIECYFLYNNIKICKRRESDGKELQYGSIYGMLL